MPERFIGKLNKKGEGSFRILQEGSVVVEADPNNTNKVKVIFSNDPEIGLHEEFFVAEKDPPDVKPQFAIYREAKRY